MQIAHNNMIPCILTNGYEFFAVRENVVKAFHNESIMSFNELPLAVYDIVRQVMQQPGATIAEMEQFVFNHWGGIDDVPDIDEHGVPSGPEYLPEYSPAYFDTGKEISPAQMRVLKLISHEDKLIADKLFMSPNTVARHCQAMFINSGIKNRATLAIWASKKGII